MFRILLLSSPSIHAQAKTWLADEQLKHHTRLESALLDLAQHHYDMVLFDHTIRPFDFLAHPTVKHTSAALIMLVPLGDHGLGETALEQGASSYRFVENLDEPSLQQALRTALKTRRTYLELQESRQLYEMILQDQSELIARFDLKRGLIFANDAFCKFYQTTREEIYGHNVTDQYIYPADLPEVEAKFAALSPKSPVFENRNRLIFGKEVRWVEWVVRGLFDEQGQLYAYQSVGRDVTEQRRVREQLSQQTEMLHQIHDAVIVTDTEFNITDWNQSAEEIYGYSAHQAIGSSLQSLLKTQIIGMTTEESMKQLYEQGAWKGEARQLNAAGEWIWVRSSVNLLKADENVIGILAINSNITPQKDVELHQQALESERYRARLLKSLIGDLTHDLLTPITTLKTSLYLVGRANDPEKQSKHLSRSEEQVEKLERILQNMMTMKRLDVSTTEARLVLSRYNINQILKDVFYDFSSRSQKVSWSLDKKLPHVLIDPNKLALVCRELLMNAFNYTPADGRIHIKSSTHNNMVVVEIQDSGLGIEAQDLPRIFDRFFRADKARNSERGGAGLGLSMVKKIIDMHGGDIQVESIPNEGSTFRILIPM